jgi:DNA-binding transcriptional regulator YbjK
MAPNPSRRLQLADAAVAILARDGVHGLTHRAVDAEADVPKGTTSNYFRTRGALVEGAARRVGEQHRQHVEQVVLRVSEGGRDAVIQGLTLLVDAAVGVGRERYLARFELALESVRRPALAVLLRSEREDSVRLADDLIARAGVSISLDRVDALASAITGIVFDRLALGVPMADTRSVVAAIVDGFMAAGAGWEATRPGVGNPETAHPGNWPGSRERTG